MSLDDLQAQLRGTLDQQFAALRQKYEDGIVEARRQADAERPRGASRRAPRRTPGSESVVGKPVLRRARRADKVGQARAEAEIRDPDGCRGARAADGSRREGRARPRRVRAARAEWETGCTRRESARAEAAQAAEAAQQEREALGKPAARPGGSRRAARARGRRTSQAAAERRRRRARADAPNDQRAAEAARAKERDALEQDVEQARGDAAPSWRSNGAAPHATGARGARQPCGRQRPTPRPNCSRSKTDAEARLTAGKGRRRRPRLEQAKDRRRRPNWRRAKDRRRSRTGAGEDQRRSRAAARSGGARRPPQHMQAEIAAAQQAAAAAERQAGRARTGAVGSVRRGARAHPRRDPRDRRGAHAEPGARVPAHARGADRRARRHLPDQRRSPEGLEGRRHSRRRRADRRVVDRRTGSAGARHPGGTGDAVQRRRCPRRRSRACRPIARDSPCR